MIAPAKVNPRDAGPRNIARQPVQKSINKRLKVTTGWTQQKAVLNTGPPVLNTGAQLISLMEMSTDCTLVTPGRRRININSFLLDVDQIRQNKTKRTYPAAAAFANYSHDVYLHWRKVERSLDPNCYFVSYPASSDMENFRRIAVRSIFSYGIVKKWKIPTLHMAVMNIQRLLKHRVDQQRNGKSFFQLNEANFAASVMACIRMAAKFDGDIDQSTDLRIHPTEIYTASGLYSQSQLQYSKEKARHLNEVEAESLEVLEHLMNPPVAPEFLMRYLEVGAWPEKYVAAYRDLALFILTLCLLADGQHHLRGTPPSQMAAAALVLAVKIINTDQVVLDLAKEYEYWPARLSAYTGYELADLRPVIRSAGMLLRNKPQGAEALQRFFLHWASFDWN